MSKKHPKHVPLPTRQQVLEFIQDSPGRVGKREIARAFNLTADQRPFLRQIMKDLETEGLVQRGHKRRLSRPGALPDVTVVEVTGTDVNGELIGKPMSWQDKDLPPPRIFLLPVRKGQPTVGIGDKVLCKLVPSGDHAYEGRVVKKLGDTPAHVLGILEVGVNGTFLRATNRRDKQDYVVARGDLGGAEPGTLVEAEILPGRTYGLRQARVITVLGDMANPRSVSLIAIHANGIPTDFPQGALDQAAGTKAAPMGKRVDLRDIPLVTIDGEDARDFDDAVWAEADGDGWHAIVAIADVAHYVRAGDALDTSAFERGNSVYFPDRVVPMLPEALSNGWCSLVPEEDRPCMAVRMWFDSQGRKHKHEFLRGMMRSAARLTYTQVQAAVDGAPDDVTGPLVETVLTPLYGVYRALREARDRRGALNIELPERKVIIGEDGSVVGVQPRPRYDSHMLIEELMIAANVCAAETLEAVKQPCMYRVHDEPALERLDGLREFLQSMDLNLARGAISPHHFNHILDKVKDTPHEHLVNQVVLRSQAQAIYSPENRGHFGLGLKRYAHFTSPIRRYSDLLVHRALISGMKFGPDGLPSDQGIEQFATMGEHISMTERRAATAEREAVDRFTAAFLADRVGASFSGRVTGVNRFGLFVELDDSGANGLIPISTLPKDYYVHDETHHALVGSASGAMHRLGDAVMVRLREADVATGGMIFEFMETIGHASAEATEIGSRLAAAARAKGGGFRPAKRSTGGSKGARNGVRAKAASKAKQPR
ncbi:MAG: ribonuclease R [Rhodospirillaceae bacterium]